MIEVIGLSNWKVVILFIEFRKIEVGKRFRGKLRVLYIYCRKLFIII